MASPNRPSETAPSSSAAMPPPPPHRSTSLHSSPRPPEIPVQLHRVHSDGSGAFVSQSRSSGQGPARRGGETWMDFLRDNDGGVGATAADALLLGGGHGQRAEMGHQNTFGEAQAALVAARKRRLAEMGESPEDRHGGHWTPPPRNTVAPAELQLDVMPQQTESLPSTEEAEPRRSSSILIPAWQPDGEVSRCPVCGTWFSFWYRKHHCRKCGRVVCSNCSPHRITIPRQYIVHPPDEMRLPTDPRDDDIDHVSNPALGGGEEVRVCNPCVPDPNFSPPPQHAAAHDGRPFNFDPSRPNFESSHLHDSPESRGHARNLTYDFTLPPHRRNSSQGQPQTPRHRTARTSSLSSHQDPFTPQYPAARPGFSGSFSTSSPFPAFHNGQHRARSGSIYSHMHYPTAEAQPRTRPHAQSYTAARPEHSSSISSPNVPNTNRSQVPPMPQRQPRREIPEEDECPICLSELPPKAPDGGTEARERHVEECVAIKFAESGGGARVSQAAQSAAVHANAMNPGDAGAGTSTADASREPTSGGLGGHSSSPLPTPPVGASSSLPAVAEGSTRRRRTTVGMLKYRATEKDCADERGEPAECVICFEEFEVGDEMGRLECFCKFHRACIRQWWDTKGDGSCPTHQGGVTLG